MTTRACRHRARDLLPFFANGSLVGEEAAEVAAHLEVCERCSRDCDALLSLTAAIDRRADLPLGRHDLPPPSRSLWPAFFEGSVLFKAAAILVAVGLAVVVLRLHPWRAVAPSAGRPGGGAQPGAAPAAVGPAAVAALDLGSGLSRGAGTLPRLALAPESTTVRLTLNLPLTPGARYSAAIRNAAGAVLVPERPLGPSDALGRVTIEVPAASFAASGDHEVVVSVRAGGGESRTFHYPFSVETASRERGGR